jgi:biotin transport system substrate-specific component
MQTTHPGRVITAAVLPRSAAVSAALVIGFALLTAVMAQVRIPLGFTPIPITGQTFAVLLSGAALGSRLGPASQALYWGLGAVGLPFYAQGCAGAGGTWPLCTGGGWEIASGASGGYLVGFVAAAWVVGRMAEGRQDRALWTAVPAFLAASVVIHLFGVPWLAHTLDIAWTEAAELGSYPFIAGDLVKVAAAGLLLPSAWRLVDRKNGG